MFHRSRPFLAALALLGGSYVVLIIAILASIAIAKFGESKRRAYLTAMKSDLRGMATVAESRFTSDNSYENVEAPKGSDGVTLTFTGTLTATRDIVVPLVGKKQWTVYNGTGQSLRFIGASGTGITVATGKHAIVRSDGTNIVRVMADT